MTFRARTAPRPTRRRTRSSDTRRAVYITVAFSLAIAAALSLMGGVFAASYYQDHGAPIASVNGEGLSKDAVNARVKLNTALFNRRLVEDQQLRNQGKITTAEESTLESSITTSLGTVGSDTLTQMIAETAVRQYAAKNGITVTDQQIDAQIVKDGTRQELRHVKIISVPLVATPPATAPTQSDSDKAQATAQGYLKEIQGGKAWDDVAKEADSNGLSSSSGGGDIGLSLKDSVNVDPDLANAIFALAKPNDITAIMKGSDGSYRFATVTEIVPESVDSGWKTAMDAAAGTDAYRDYAKNEALKQLVQDKVEAKYITGPTVQRYVNEIATRLGYGQTRDGDEVKIKIMVFAPGHAEANATTDTTTTDAAWTDALTRAKAAEIMLKADPSKFVSMAQDKTINDDTNFNASGGDIPWIPSDWFNATTEADPSTGQTSTGLGMTNVQAAVFKDGLTPNTVLDPVLEPSYGYVLTLFEGRRPAPDQRIADAAFAINSGTDFATEAKLVSEASDALTGGTLGWVSPYMLSTDQQQAVFSTPVGSVSNVLTTSRGFFIYQVTKEETRVADPDQQAKLKKVVFPSWLAELQANSLIWEDTAAVSALASATPAQ
jgi:parvulin-like peptidyl-prolyl isomerase